MVILPGASIIGYDGSFPKLGAGAFLAPGAHIIGDVIAGHECSFWFNTVTRGDCNYIRIGNRVNIQDGSVIHVTSKFFPTKIEDNVSIGHNATIHGCYIKEGCLIGMGATLLDGSEIGAKSFVAAGSLVPPEKKYPGGVLIKGCPAKVVRKLTKRDFDILNKTTEYYLDYKSKYEDQPIITHQKKEVICPTHPEMP